MWEASLLVGQLLDDSMCCGLDEQGIIESSSSCPTNKEASHIT